MPLFFYDPRHSVGGLSSQCHCRLRFLFTGVTEITAVEVNAKGEGDSFRMIKTLLEDRGKEEGKEAETPTAVCISSHKFVSSFSLSDVYDTLFFFAHKMAPLRASLSSRFMWCAFSSWHCHPVLAYSYTPVNFHYCVSLPFCATWAHTRHCFVLLHASFLLPSNEVFFFPLARCSDNCIDIPLLFFHPCFAFLMLLV